MAALYGGYFMQLTTIYSSDTGKPHGQETFIAGFRTVRHWYPLFII